MAFAAGDEEIGVWWLPVRETTDVKRHKELVPAAKRSSPQELAAHGAAPHVETPGPGREPGGSVDVRPVVISLSTKDGRFLHGEDVGLRIWFLQLPLRPLLGFVLLLLNAGKFFLAFLESGVRSSGHKVLLSC